MKQKQILFLGGDGVGPEVVAQARRVAEWFVAQGLDASLEDAPYGMAQVRLDGELISSRTLAACRRVDAIIFGATGGPEVDGLPAAVIERGGLLMLREALGLFANLRPIRPVSALSGASTLKAEAISGVDLVIVRELCGGVYFGKPRGIETLPDGQRRGVDTQVYTSSEIRRIARFGFELAQQRSKLLCSVDKSNVMESGKLWRDEVTRMQAAEFPDVALSHMYADNCAMQLVRNPRQFDVIVTDNLFGDILSDTAAMICGSLGMLPSASLGEPDAHGRRNALYEPVHGSAPDIAGQGIANPLGTILSLAMALRHSLAAPDHAELLERAVQQVLDEGARTRDLCSAGEAAMTTSQMGDAVLRMLNMLHSSAQ